MTPMPRITVRLMDPPAPGRLQAPGGICDDFYTFDAWARGEFPLWQTVSERCQGYNLSEPDRLRVLAYELTRKVQELDSLLHECKARRGPPVAVVREGNSVDGCGD